MSQSVASPASARTAATSNLPDTRLHGHWLLLAWVGWLAVVIFTVVLFVGSLPAYYALLQVPCSSPAACSLNGPLTASGIQALRAVGISPSAYATFTLTLTLASEVLWSVVGLVIFWRRSDDWVALLVALVLVIFNVGQQATAPSALVLTSPGWTVPVQVVNFLSEVAVGLFFFLFPGGRFVPRWTRWVAVVYIVYTALGSFPPADSPLNTTNWPLLLTALLFIGPVFLLIFSQIYRYRRVSNPVQRQQIKWAVFGIVVTAVLLIGLSLSFLIPALNQPDSLFSPVINTLYPLALLPIPLSICFAILRYRLWDIDTIINRALVYGGLTGLLGAVYAGLIISLESLVAAITGHTGQQPVVLVISTLAIAALFQPVRTRLQGIIDRRFYRSKYDAARTLAHFSATLRNEVNVQELQDHLLEVIQETMQPAYVSLWLRQLERHPEDQAYRLEPHDQVPTRRSSD